MASAVAAAVNGEPSSLVSSAPTTICVAIRESQAEDNRQSKKRDVSLFDVHS